MIVNQGKLFCARNFTRTAGDSSAYLWDFPVEPYFDSFWSKRGESTSSQRYVFNEIFYGEEEIKIKSSYKGERYQTDTSVAGYTLKYPPNFFILLGSGSEEELLETNVKIAGTDIMSKLSFEGSTVTTAYENLEDFVSITALYKNNTAKEVEIKEVGLAVELPGNQNNSWRGKLSGDHEFVSIRGISFLLTRDILDTPIIIQPGEKYSFTVSIGL